MQVTETSADGLKREYKITIPAGELEDQISTRLTQLGQQINGRDRTGFVMLPRHARAVYDKYSKRGLPTPVAIVIGVHPAIWLSAGYTTGPGIDAGLQ